VILFDVNSPVLIEVAGEADGSELNDGFSHLLGPAHATPSTGPGAIGHP
jgi:hypothetical protein